MYQVANRDFGIKNYILIVLITSLAVFSAFALDRFLFDEKSGLLMGLLEVSFEAFMFWRLHRLHLDTQKRVYQFKWFFLFLGIGDFFYMLFFYVLKLSSRRWYSLLLITVPYSVAYLYGAFGVLAKNLGKKFLIRSKLAFSVYLFCIPIVMRLLVIPFVDNVGVNDGVAFLLVEVIALIGLYFLLCHSVMTLIASNVFFWSNISSAMIILVVSDWALRVEKLIDNSPTFGFYEALYCLGVSMMVASFVELKRIPSALRYDSLSLSSSVKKFTLIAVCASTIFLSLSQYGTRESIRFGILSVVFGVFLVQMIGIYINEQIYVFTDRVSRLAEEKAIVIDRKSARVMPVELLSAFRQVVELQVKLIRQKIEFQNRITMQQKLSEKAAQVSHDIRSPLAALEMISGSLDELPVEKRVLIRNSVHRIRDIANDLLREKRMVGPSVDSEISDSIVDDTENLEVALLEPLIETIVSEKRIRYREYAKIEVVFDLSSDSYGLFASIKSHEFKRVLSNLMNNALESLVDHQGVVRVTLRKDIETGMILIKIEDTGIGMDHSVLARLGEKGFTHGKSEGTGIGLNYSISKIRGMGGKISFSSQKGKGTAVEIVLPLSEGPEWFVAGVSLPVNGTLIIVDDDQSMHDVWSRRLSLIDPDRKINLLNFRSPKDFSDYMNGSASDSGKSVFLVDFEFNGFDMNGVQLIQRHGIASKAILVTSHHEDGMVIRSCLNAGIKLIPKRMSGFVPIRLI